MTPGSQTVSDIQNCLIIAEVAQAHDGSLGTAHAFIDAAARSGVDAIKFQTHIAAEESTRGEPWRVKFSRQDVTRYDYWRRMEFSEEQWCGLKAHATEKGLLFLSSPFSIAAVELLTRVGVAGWKIASGEVSNGPLFDRMAETGLPILLSTGMSDLNEIDAAVSQVQRRGLDLLLFQCTSKYPTPPDELGLNLIPEFARRYGCKVGLSDHSGTIYAGLGAVTLGARALEVHLTLSRDMFGPDVPVSLTPAELADLVRGVRFLERALAHPIDKNVMARSLDGMRQLFTKSVVVKASMDAGAVLTEADLSLKKPGTGFPPERLPSLIGRRLARAVEADHLLSESDLSTE